MTSTLFIDVLADKLRQLGRLDPAKLKAVDVLVDAALGEAKGAASAARGLRGRTILGRLQAVHDCQQPDGGQFEQLQPHGRRRSWKCSGCERIVTDDEIAPREGGA